MTLYEKTYGLKFTLISVLALLVIVSFMVDHWVLQLVDDYFTSFIPFFKKTEQISDSLTNNLSVTFLILNSIGLLISSLFFINQKWSTFFFLSIIVFIGAALITNYFKVSFGRIRPVEVIEQGLTGIHYWFAEGDSFPSGHTSYYFSLFFPMYYYFDRLKPIILIPIFIALGRMIQKTHFISDILMSVWIVVALTIITDLFISWIIGEIKKISFQ